MSKRVNLTTENFTPLFEKALSDNFANVFLNALNNEQIKLQLSETFASMIDLIVEEKVNKVKVECEERIKIIQQENNQKISMLEKEVKSVKMEQEEQLQYSFKEDLIVKGLDISYGAAANPEPVDCKRKVLQLFNNEMHLKIKESDISTAHTLPNSRQRNQTTKKSPAPTKVIVRFANRDARNTVYASRLTLKSSLRPTFIEEHLTPERSKLFFTARTLKLQKKLFATWTKGCKLFAVAKQGDVPFNYKSEQDLLSHIPGMSSG